MPAVIYQGKTDPHFIVEVAASTGAQRQQIRRQAPQGPGDESGASSIDVDGAGDFLFQRELLNTAWPGFVRPTPGHAPGFDGQDGVVSLGFLIVQQPPPGEWQGLGKDGCGAAQAKKECKHARPASRVQKVFHGREMTGGQD